MHPRLSPLWIIALVAAACGVSEPPRTNDRASAVSREWLQLAHVQDVQTDWQCVTVETFNATVTDLQNSCIEDGGDFQWDVIGTGTDVLNGAVYCRDDQYAIEYSCAR
jgi:hypothetical protein